jgi:hypothetical protein
VLEFGFGWDPEISPIAIGPKTAILDYIARTCRRRAKTVFPIVNGLATSRAQLMKS